MKLIVALCAFIGAPCIAAPPESLLTQANPFNPSFEEVGFNIWRDQADNIWLKTAGSSPLDSLWINLDSVQSSGDIQMLTVFGDHRKNSSVTYRFSLQRQLINCRTLSTRMQGREYFGASGELVSTAAATRWSRIKAGSPEEALASAVCD